jgi:hypothetical protein
MMMLQRMELQILSENMKQNTRILSAQYQTENQFEGCGCTRVYQYPRIQGKYIAMFEGDDYWTDS